MHPPLELGLGRPGQFYPNLSEKVNTIQLDVMNTQDPHRVAAEKTVVVTVRIQQMFGNLCHLVQF